MCKIVCKYIDLEKEIDQCIDMLVDKRKEVIGVIEQLNANEYDLLHKIYVQYMTFEEAADTNNKSYSWVTSVHGAALNHVQNILDNRKMQKNAKNCI